MNVKYSGSNWRHLSFNQHFHILSEGKKIKAMIILLQIFKKKKTAYRQKWGIFVDKFQIHIIIVRQMLSSTPIKNTQKKNLALPSTFFKVFSLMLSCYHYLCLFLFVVLLSCTFLLMPFHIKGLLWLWIIEYRTCVVLGPAELPFPKKWLEIQILWPHPRSFK